MLYLPGLKNFDADFLSLPNQATTGSVAAASAADPMDFEEMAAEQNCCPETQRCLAGDVSTGNFRTIVPLKFRKNIFDYFHNVAHLGRLASRRIISSRFVWRGLSSDVTAWARGCLARQLGKIHCHNAWFPSPSPSRNGVFLIYKLIWWALCSTVIVLIIFLPLLIAHPSGWKRSPFQKRPRRHAQKL
jgi:hypothetical protein